MRPIRYSFHLRLYLILMAGLTLAIINVTAQDLLFIPEDPLQGRLVFERKGCLKCHAVMGEGAFIGPDLGKEHFQGGFIELGRVMWNHSPDMTQRMKDMLQSRPSFTVKEIQDLFVYLHYLKYLGEPGDSEAGKRLFAEKNCLDCHSNVGGKSAPAMSSLAAYASPVALAQAMWNHGPAMDQQMHIMGITRPRFDGEEVTHLAAYLRSVNHTKSEQARLMKPGDPRLVKYCIVKRDVLTAIRFSELVGTRDLNFLMPLRIAVSPKSPE